MLILDKVSHEMGERLAASIPKEPERARRDAVREKTINVCRALDPYFFSDSDEVVAGTPSTSGTLVRLPSVEVLNDLMATTPLPADMSGRSSNISSVHGVIDQISRFEEDHSPNPLTTFILRNRKEKTLPLKEKYQAQSIIASHLEDIPFELKTGAFDELLGEFARSRKETGTANPDDATLKAEHDTLNGLVSATWSLPYSGQAARWKLLLHACTDRKANEGLAFRRVKAFMLAATAIERQHIPDESSTLVRRHFGKLTPIQRANITHDILQKITCVENEAIAARTLEIAMQHISQLPPLPRIRPMMILHVGANLLGTVNQDVLKLALEAHIENIGVGLNQTGSRIVYGSVHSKFGPDDYPDESPIDSKFGLDKLSITESSYGKLHQT